MSKTHNVNEEETLIETKLREILAEKQNLDAQSIKLQQKLHEKESAYLKTFGRVKGLTDVIISFIDPKSSEDDILFPNPDTIFPNVDASIYEDTHDNQLENDKSKPKKFQKRKDSKKRLSV